VTDFVMTMFWAPWFQRSAWSQGHGAPGDWGRLMDLWCSERTFFQIRTREKFAYAHRIDAILNGHTKQISDRGMQFVRSASGSNRTSVKTVNQVPKLRHQLLPDSCAVAWGLCRKLMSVCR
jgi:hypothetical protein